jgi:hypothetical protein
VPLPLVALILLVMGSLFIGIGVYALRLYRSGFRADQASSMRRDVTTVLLFGSWSAPPLLAGILIFFGAICLLLLGAITVFSLTALLG